MTPEPARRPLIAGNWKLWGTRAQASEYCDRLLELLPDRARRRADVGLCGAVHVARHRGGEASRKRRDRLCADDGREETGAFTGEVSARHAEGDRRGRRGARSLERRAYDCETDRALQDKVPAAFGAGLLPILCVGETEEEREGGETERKLRYQVQEGLEKVTIARLSEVVIAYEPIWAIGTGKVATPEIAQEAIAFIRALVGDRSREAAERVRVLYGGSVKPDNAAEILAQRDVDGALVGGASPRSRGFRPHRGRGGASPGVVSFERACLIVLDGWGLAEPGPGNAVSLADTPVFDELWERYPHTTLTAWGPAVGLPEGQMGNSEVGHLNLGAGTIVKQDLLRIDEAVDDGSFFENEALREACKTERLHLLGLVSAGGVHASMKHLEALIELAGPRGRPRRGPAAFTDGRDTLPDSGAGYLAEVEGWGGARSPRWPAATTRWTATSAGTARSWRSPRSWTARPSSPPRAARRQCARPTTAARPTSSSSRRWWGERAGSAPATA